ncbi:MAG: PTS sugar transporter subunit IIC [Erysipelotrichaceae bacterium]|jgi:PTS system mannose-specific IIC component/fructoselysine and glucoselysine-specific PTS system IIC component|nr:PTS sugar transporter subunit IIC [Erysipelotrichaceae bacterium]
MSVTTALIVAFVYVVIYNLDNLWLSWQCLSRPIVIAPVAGLFLGDFRTGIIMGAGLESIFMGISAIGGSIPADPTTASIVAVAYAITSGGDMETGLAIALPIGTLMTSFSGILMPFFSSLAAYWEKLATSGNIKNFTWQVIVVGNCQTLISGAILFVGLAYGVSGLSSLLGSLPAWVLTGLGAATSMMLAVGFAILTSMIWSGEIGIFFFVGYILARFVGLGSLQIALLGAAIAITMFFSEKRIIDLKNSLDSSASASKGDDFF